MKVFQPTEPQGLHRVRHARLLVTDDLHEAGDAHAQDGPDARRPRGLREVDLARALGTVVVANVVRRSHVSDFGEDEVLQGGLLVAPPASMSCIIVLYYRVVSSYGIFVQGIIVWYHRVVSSYGIIVYGIIVLRYHRVVSSCINRYGRGRRRKAFGLRFWFGFPERGDSVGFSIQGWHAPAGYIYTDDHHRWRCRGQDSIGFFDSRVASSNMISWVLYS